MSKTPPTFVLTTGSFAHPSMYVSTTDLLPKHLTLHIPHLPTVSGGKGLSGTVPAPSMYDDAAMIRGKIAALADEGKDVVLLAHSYGGIPATEALKGVTRAEREKEGKKGGVVRIGYLTCLVPEVGGTAVGVLAGVSDEDRLEFEIREDGWMESKDLNRTREVVASEMKREDAEPWFANWPRHSAASFMNELTHAGYKDVPVSYLLCELDKCVTPDVQRKGIEVIERESGRKVDVTAAQVDHAPNVTAPQVLVDWIVKMAEIEAK